MTVYADNAATTQMSDSVLKAMMPLLTDIYGNPSSLHSVGQIAKEHLEAARETVAECIGADPKEIYFTSGGSEADNQAIRSAAYIGARKGKKHIISSKFEHHAVLHTLDALKKEGFTVTLLDVYSNGIVKPEDVANAITDETCLVTIMTANNEIGTIQPIAEIGKICKEKGVLFHTDAVQAVGHIPVNVKDMNCDMLSVSAHKFHGPKGVGFLYARKGILLTNIIYGGAQERNKRAGTENMASIVGMATAIKDATDHLHTRMISGGHLQPYEGGEFLYGFLCGLLRHVLHPAAFHTESTASQAALLMEKEFATIGGIDEVAKRLNISSEHLSRSFHSEWGIAPVQYLNRMRIQSAMNDLLGSTDTIEVIAAKNGFANGNYFAKVFRRYTKMTPGEYRCKKAGQIRTLSV